MARSSLRDPLDKYRWTVTVDGFSKVGFHTSSIPKYNITSKNYPEGGAHLHPRQIVDSISYAPVMLSRGVSNDTSFNKWANGFIDKVTNDASFNGSTDESVTVGGGAALPANSPLTAAINGAANNGAKAIRSHTGSLETFSYRRTVKIEHVNRAGQVEVIYMLYNAFPLEYSPASDFGAMDDDGVSIESITLGYESFEVMYSGLAGTLANLLT